MEGASLASFYRRLYLVGYPCIAHLGTLLVVCSPWRAECRACTHACTHARMHLWTCNRTCRRRRRVCWSTWCTRQGNKWTR